RSDDFLHIALLCTATPYEFSTFDFPGQILDIGEGKFANDVVQLSGDQHGGTRIDEGSCTDLNGAGACDQEFGSIQAADDASQANNRDLDGLCRLVDQSEGQGLDRGSGEAAITRADAGFSGCRINGERNKRID